MATTLAAEQVARDPVPLVTGNSQPATTVHSISVVVPVYRGEGTLARLVAEIEPLTHTQQTALGNSFRVTEVLLVHDGAIDRSDLVMEELGRRYAFVRLIWLARNFGQHPATLAGAASSTSDWVVTLDEDGDQNPAEIGRFLDRALETGAQLVYALPTNSPSHGWLRNLLSAVTKRFLVSLVASNGVAVRFHSFRLIHGEIARSLAAYCGHNVYLDVALSWVVSRSTHCGVVLRGSLGRKTSGYNYSRLLAHFWRLVLTSGVRPLRLVTLLGLSSIGVAAGTSLYALWAWWHGEIPIHGWASLTILLCFFSGGMLFSLGVIAEYLGATLSVAIGRPLYLVVSRPCRGKSVQP